MLRDWLVSIRSGGEWSQFIVDAIDKEVVEDEETREFRTRLAASGLSAGTPEMLFNLATVPTPESFSSASIEELNRAERSIAQKIGIKKKGLLADQLTINPDPPGGYCRCNCRSRSRSVWTAPLSSGDQLFSAAAPRLSGEPGNVLSGADTERVQLRPCIGSRPVLPIQRPSGSGKRM
jgi:hypothetical protein